MERVARQAELELSVEDLEGRLPDLERQIDECIETENFELAETLESQRTAAATELAAMRAELKKRTQASALPFIFIKGQYVGGLSNGGPVNGGINGLMKGDMLVPMLEGAGAVKRSRLDSTPLAPLRGNNLRNALGSLGGGGNPFQP